MDTDGLFIQQIVFQIVTHKISAILHIATVIDVLNQWGFLLMINPQGKMFCKKTITIEMFEWCLSPSANNPGSRMPNKRTPLTNKMIHPLLRCNPPNSGKFKETSDPREFVRFWV